MTDKPRLIDADKLLAWMSVAYETNSTNSYEKGKDHMHVMVDSLISQSYFDPDQPQQPDIQVGARNWQEEAEICRTPRPLDEWHEDHGAVLWWEFPIVEPPYCGTPLDADWPDYHTHWTPITIPVTTERYFKCHECLEYSNAAEWNEKTENTLGRSIIHIEAKWLGMEYICPKCGAEQDEDDITEWENTP